MHDRLQQVRSFSVEAARHVVRGQPGEIDIRDPDELYKWIDNTQRRFRLPAQFGLTVFDSDGNRLFYKSAPPRPGEPHPEADPSFPAVPALIDRIQVEQSGGFYTILTPIYDQDRRIGTIAISYAKRELMRINQHYGLIGTLLVLSGLLGWIIIYWMLRQMTKPIRLVIQAFRQIEAGNYTRTLKPDAKEQEIYDLLVYYNAMAERLEQLEQLRTELLSGVTHELRTPLTSIRGLTRAVRDQVVEADEADEFLDLSLKETKRLEQMVSDLLHFNAYASGSVQLQLEEHDLGKLLNEIVYQWSLTHLTGQKIELATDIPDCALTVPCDADRLQQIIVNLLNNSRQAMQETGKIHVIVRPYKNSYYEVLLKDTGSGIPADEQTNIFERYYRGTNKRQKVRGLGLGLTLCRMLAHAMGGSLNLQESSPKGTTFQLLLKGSVQK